MNKTQTKLSVILALSLWIGGINASAATDKDFEAAMDGVNAAMSTQAYTEAQAALETAKRLAQTPAETLQVDVAWVCLVAAKGKAPLPIETLETRLAAAQKDGVTDKQCYDALNRGATLMTCSRHYAQTRALLALGDKLVVAQEKKTMVCRYHEQVPLGAGGWCLSDYINEPKNREARFQDYDQKAADRLFADITTERSVTSQQNKKAYYLEHTGFSMMYDKAGWHMFVLCGEPNTDEILADGRPAGALEMFFSPGTKGQTYSQWITDLPSGKTTVYDWNSPHRYFRTLKPYIKTETVTSGKNWGTYIFIPWEAIYDTLPLDGETWPFGLIRWSPAGGLTWGGKVHEIGRWGQVQWEKPNPEQATVIRKNILRKAWGKYQKSKTTQIALWKDLLLGDPTFLEEMLTPAVSRLDAYGVKVKDLNALSVDQVTQLYLTVVSDWMEFDYLVNELRRVYLQKKLITK